MKAVRLPLLLLLALPPAHAARADAGTVTVLEGSARVMRGAAWLRLAEGAGVQEGDVIEAQAKAQVQVELADGGTLNLYGPGELFAAAVPLRQGKLSGPAAFTLTGGWLKLAARAPHGGLRVTTPLAEVATSDAVLVVHADAAGDAVFLESGSARLTDLDRRGAPSSRHDAKGGQFFSRAASDASSTPSPPTPAFLGSLPHHFIDPLPSRAERFQNARVELAADHPVTYPEARPWLQGPFRHVFLRRLRPRLKDPVFRRAVEPDVASYPEWDRILHPEKYLPKKEGERR